MFPDFAIDFFQFADFIQVFLCIFYIGSSISSSNDNSFLFFLLNNHEFYIQGYQPFYRIGILGFLVDSSLIYCSFSYIDFQFNLSERGVFEPFDIKFLNYLMKALIKEFGLLIKFNIQPVIVFVMSHSIHAGSPSARYEVSPLSSKHQQVQNSKNIIKINEAIKSIMEMGKMEKMNLIAINNRSLFNYGKVKRAEWTNRKLSQEKSTFLPDLKALKLDHQHKNILKCNTESIDSFSIELKNENQPKKKDLCEQLIDQYIQKLKDENKLVKGVDKNKLIAEACKQIKQKLISHQKKKENAIQDQAYLKQISSRKSFKYQNSKKHRSITEAAYNEDLNRLSKNLQYTSKKRMEGQRLFLRRIKQMKRLSIHE